MTQIQFTTSKGKFLAVKVPKEASGYKMDVYGIIFDIKHGLISEYIEIPKWFKILSPLSEITEELWEEVVDKITKPLFGNYYRDYLSNYQPYPYVFAKESGESLIQSLEITEGNWILLKVLPC